MSKLVNWGHWLVAVLLGVLGLYFLGGFAFALVVSKELRGSVPSGHEGMVMISLNLVAWLPFLICAWGVLRWRPWGHALTITLCALAILVEVETLIFRGIRGFAAAEILKLTVACLVVVWLLLPSVRTQYLRREQIA
jgi:hypothetical protein